MVVIFKYTAIFSILFSISGSAIGEAKPLRRDCISRMEINWASAPGVDKEKAINEIVRIIAHAPQKKYNLMSSGIAIRGNYREFIYFQYGFDCDEKYENTLDLASHIQNHINIEITVSEKNFSPRVDTIRVSGPLWADQEEQVGKRVIIDGKPYIKVD